MGICHGTICPTKWGMINYRINQVQWAFNQTFHLNISWDMMGQTHWDLMIDIYIILYNEQHDTGLSKRMAEFTGENEKRYNLPVGLGYSR
jgi:hypothetical protein